MGAHGLAMDVGDVFTPDGMSKDTQAIEDFYGSKGYIDVVQGPALRVIRVPNVDTGTMDLEFQIDEGQKSYVEKIDIRGNVEDQGQSHPPRTGHFARRKFRHGARENQQAAPRRLALF